MKKLLKHVTAIALLLVVSLSFFACSSDESNTTYYSLKWEALPAESQVVEVTMATRYEANTTKHYFYSTQAKLNGDSKAKVYENCALLVYVKLEDGFKFEDTANAVLVNGEAIAFNNSLKPSGDVGNLFAFEFRITADSVITFGNIIAA